MGTRASFYPSVLPDAVLGRLPHRHRAFVNLAALGVDPVDLLSFETGPGHVVTLKDLRRALSRTPRQATALVAVGYDFTEEARSEVAALGGVVFAEHNVWAWTEERWHAVRAK